MSTEPPGPNGVPVIGNSHQYARDPFTFIDACARAYGDVATFTLGGERMYMLTNPDDIGRVLVSDAGTYGKPDLAGDAVAELLGTGLLLSERELWRERRSLVQPAFDHERIVRHARTMTDHAKRLYETWNAGEVHDVHVEMAQLTVNIIVDVMFGTSLDHGTIRRVQKALEPLGARFEPDPTRFLVPEWVPTKENREFRDGVATLERVLDDVIRERRATGLDPDAEDMLSILLRARDKGTVSGADVRDELMTMLLAGHDTTALVLTYTWYLLAEHPEADARLADELDRVLGGEAPTVGDVRALKYTDRVLKESMRLYPPVYALFRQPHEAVELGGYRIPRGSPLMLPQWAVHRDPRYYDHPDEFDPDRWSRERVAARPTYAYFPFGAGPRQCIGKRFAMMEATLLLATIARRYRLERVGEGPLSLRGTLTMHPREPVEMRLHERNES